MFRIKKRLRGKRNPNPRNNSMQKDREDKILEAVRDFMIEGLKDMREHGGDCESVLSQTDIERSSKK